MRSNYKNHTFTYTIHCCCTRTCYCIPFGPYAFGKRERKKLIKSLRLCCNCDSWSWICHLTIFASYIAEKCSNMRCTSGFIPIAKIFAKIMRKKMYLHMPYQNTLFIFSSSLTFVLGSSYFFVVASNSFLELSYPYLSSMKSNWDSW